MVDWEEATLEAADKEDKVEAIVDETEEIVEDAAVATADREDCCRRDRLDRGGHQGHGRGGFGSQANVISVCANYFEIICFCYGLVDLQPSVSVTPN